MGIVQNFISYINYCALVYGLIYHKKYNLANSALKKNTICKHPKSSIKIFLLILLTLPL